MRLIDAYRLIEDMGASCLPIMEKGISEITGDESCIVDHINSAPTIDAVPVVRCKDCLHAAPLEGYASRKFEIGLNCRACRGDSGYGIVGLSFTVPDGYCDDGLRRAGEPHD